MKKLAYIFGVLVLILSSCADLEEKPIGVLTPESYFKSEGDLEAAVLGLYNTATDAQISQDYDVYDMLSEEYDVDPTTFRPYRFNFNEFRYTPSDMTDVVYRASYSRIAYANMILPKIKNVEMTDEKKDMYRAEVLWLRDFTYFELVGMFGDVPYLEELLPNPADGSGITRTPAEEILGHIIDDLTWCLDHLPENYGVSRNKASRGTALTLLAKVHLDLATFNDVFRNSYDYRTIDEAYVESLKGSFSSHWEAAAFYAEEVIKNKAAFGYDLVEDFQDLFNGEVGDTKEHIYSVDYFSEAKGGYAAGQDFDGWRNNNNGFVPLRKPWDVGGWSGYVPPMSFYNSFIPGDYRREVSFETDYAITTSSVNGDTTQMINYTALTDQAIKAPGCAKWTRYPGPVETWPDGIAASFNVPVLRYGEVLLIAAEALNETGKTAEAIGYLNQLRARARFAGGQQRAVPADVPMGLSQEACWDTIWKERSYELAFEWKRFRDLVRRDSLIAVMSRFVPYHTGEPIGDRVQNYHKLLPLPQAELDLTSMKQNKGY